MGLPKKHEAKPVFETPGARVGVVSWEDYRGSAFTAMELSAPAYKAIIDRAALDERVLLYLAEQDHPLPGHQVGPGISSRLREELRVELPGDTSKLWLISDQDSGIEAAVKRSLARLLEQGKVKKWGNRERHPIRTSSGRYRWAGSNAQAYWATVENGTTWERAADLDEGDRRVDEARSVAVAKDLKSELERLGLEDVDVSTDTSGKIELTIPASAARSFRQLFVGEMYR